jgi:hypothetical protein
MIAYVTGDSHVDAIVRAKPSGFKPFFLGNGSFEAEPFSSSDQQEVWFTINDYTRSLAKNTGKQAISNDGDVWGILMGTHTARIYRDPSWRQFEPAPIAQSGCQPVSDAILRDIIHADFRYIAAFFESLRKAGVSFFVISAPYPRQDHASIIRGTRKEVVRYIDQMYRHIVTAWLAERQIRFIDPPPETINDGFLRREFAASPPDPHHANLTYGQLMAAKIAKFLAETR